MYHFKLKSDKAKLFIDNFLVYGVGGIISKVIPLIMLPLITRLMPNTEYFGISDLSNTAVSFCSALAVIGMYDAMFRMFFEKDDEKFKKAVCSTSIVFTSAMSVAVTLAMIFFQDFIATHFFGNIKYSYLVYITAATVLVSATNSIIAAPTRMQNKKTDIIIRGIIASVLSYSISIPLILMGEYVIALPIAALISGAAIEISFAISNREWFNPHLFDIHLLKQLLLIAVPLFPNFLVYWIFNSSDRIMITNILDVGEAGIYAIGSKLGNMSQLIYMAFAGGWQYFAFSTMKESNQVESNSRVFEYLGVISFSVSVFVFSLSKFIFEIIFPVEYRNGYIVSPYLFMAPLLQMLFQVAGNQFIVVKKTWPNMFILMVGALSNVFLNLYLIPVLGIEGASIATLIGYLISIVIGCTVLIQMNLMRLSLRFICACIVMVLYILLWRFCLIDSIYISLMCAALASSFMVGLYKNDLQKII